jgi:predicted ATPase with chaperone activity
MPNLLLVGPTNNGKAMVVEKFRRLLLLPSPWARLAD